MFPIDLLQAFTQRLARPFPWSRPPQGIMLTPSATILATGGQVPAKRTTLTRTQAKAALKTAMTSVLGRAPTPAELKMLVAQSDLETRGWAAMWNWNFGNLVVGSTGAPWFMIPSDTTHKYHSFGNAAEGAKYWVQRMQKRFSDAWALLNSEDTYAFAQALHDQSYYEGTAGHSPEQIVQDYASGLASRYALA
jgi:hypothetical protein